MHMYAGQGLGTESRVQHEVFKSSRSRELDGTEFILCLGKLPYPFLDSLSSSVKWG